MGCSSWFQGQRSSAIASGLIITGMPVWPVRLFVFDRLRRPCQRDGCHRTNRANVVGWDYRSNPQRVTMNKEDRELSLEELEIVVGGSDLAFQLQQAMNAQSQAYARAASTAKGYHDTTAAILRNFGA